MYVSCVIHNCEHNFNNAASIFLIFDAQLSLNFDQCQHFIMKIKDIYLRKIINNNFLQQGLIKLFVHSSKIALAPDPNTTQSQ